MTRGDPSYRRQRQQGFTYILLLVFVTVSGVTLARAGLVWDTESRRERETELLFVGEQIAQAIRSFHDLSPGAKTFPRSLDDLLEDRRTLVVRRHLRRPYLDPMTGSVEWGLVRAPDGGIRGVYSLSTQTPLRTAGLSASVVLEGDGGAYTSWRFMARAPLPVTAAGAASSVMHPQPTLPAGQQDDGAAGSLMR